ncbi:MULTISPECIES: AAA family ATPase [Niastella]|uniref:AAA family ATPase n=1 Tax=Niastella TaxID=354354 RepID=UPI0036080862
MGKTTAIRQIGKDFSQFIYLNLELPEDKKPFLEFVNFDTLLQTLFFLKDKSLSIRSETLIFIDEIQIRSVGQPPDLRGLFLNIHGENL